MSEKLAKVKETVAGCATLLTIALVAGWLMCRPASKPRDPKGPPEESEIITMACQFVKDRLKAPATASFPWGFKEYKIEEVAKERYRVSGYVDAQNIFGAMIRQRWTVLMHRTDPVKQMWALEKIEIVE